MSADERFGLLKECDLHYTRTATVTIEFQFTWDDYRNGFRAHYKKGASLFTRWLMKFSLAGSRGAENGV